MTRRSAASAPEDLFEAIARLLEPSQREYFYQRMLYFRHLRPEDELLRLVEAMGRLALLIREAPHAVAREREQTAQLLETSLATIHAAGEAGQPWEIDRDRRPYGLRVVLPKRTYVLPWAQFLYAEGVADRVHAVFSMHDVIVTGCRLDALLADVAAQVVTVSRQPSRAEGFVTAHGLAHAYPPSRSAESRGVCAGERRCPAVVIGVHPRSADCRRKRSTAHPDRARGRSAGPTRGLGARRSAWHRGRRSS